LLNEGSYSKAADRQARSSTSALPQTNFWPFFKRSELDPQKFVVEMPLEDLGTWLFDRVPVLCSDQELSCIGLKTLLHQAGVG